METEKIQRAKVGKAGSFINQMMSNNNTLPEVGKGATQLLYSDRICYEVISISKNGKTVLLEHLDAEWNNELSGGEGHQNWILKPSGRFITIVWRQGAWRQIGKETVFTDEFINDCVSKGIKYIGMWLRKNNPELADKIYGENVMPSNIVDGYTKEKTSYNKINIIFGIKDYYYDWSF